MRPIATVLLASAFLIVVQSIPYSHALTLQEGKEKTYFYRYQVPGSAETQKEINTIEGLSAVSRQVTGELSTTRNFLEIKKTREGSYFMPIWKDTDLNIQALLDSMDRFVLETEITFKPENRGEDRIGVYWGYESPDDFSAFILLDNMMSTLRYAGGKPAADAKWEKVRYNGARSYGDPVNDPGFFPKNPPYGIKYLTVDGLKLTIQIRRLGEVFKWTSPGSPGKQGEGLVISLNGYPVKIIPVQKFSRWLGQFGIYFGGKGSLRLRYFKVRVPPGTASVSVGDDALRQGRYDVALSHFRPLAMEAKDPVAQWRLGTMYLQGAGLDRNLEAARNWLKRSAEQGQNGARITLAELLAWGPPEIRDTDEARQHLLAVAGEKSAWQREAEYRLGRIYGEGVGVPLDYAESKKWLERAIQGTPQPQALFTLGMLYGRGLGVSQDLDRARQFFERAARLGEIQSITTLGVMYARGEGVSADLVESHKWFTIALAQAPTDQLKAEIQKNVTQVEGRLTPRQLEESQKRVRAWLEGH